MPDVHWWMPYYECKNFGPSIANGKVDESLPIMCHDKNLLSGWWDEAWKWSIDGKSINGQMDNLMKTKGKPIGDYFTYGKP